MTNLEKLMEVLKKTFPGTGFVEDEIETVVRRCQFIDCKQCKMSRQCDIGPGYSFWESEYEVHDLKPEPDAEITTGYVVMVDDEGTEIPYSGCIHPTFRHAEDEAENAEYHGWTTSIRAVKFRFTSKGGGKNA